MDAATKTGMDAAKIGSKRVVQKTAKATRDLIGNMIKLLHQIKQRVKRKKKNNKKYTYHQKNNHIKSII